MARVFPDKLVGVTTPELLRLYRLLRGLPDEFSIRYRLPMWSRPGPDFWVLREDGRSVWLKVSTATAHQAQTAQQARLFDDGQAAGPIGEAEQAALHRFAQQMAETLPGSPPILEWVPGVVMFPNVPEADLRQAMLAEPPGGIIWIGREVLSPERLEAWLEARLGPPLADQAVVVLRKAFTPEVIIPADFTTRQPIERGVTAHLTDYLLDYDQEWALKLDLDLSEEAQAVTGDFGLRLINGVAGSGKSLVIVYRAHLLRQLYPEKRILVLTHNRALIHDLQVRYRQLSQDGRPLEWGTFMRWCQAQWPEDVAQPQLVREGRRRAIITAVWRNYLNGTFISERMLQDEIDWFKDRALHDLGDYLATDRTGRGFAMNEAMRRHVYQAITAYQQALAQHNCMDWGDVPRRLWEFIGQGHRLPVYDAVLVDEAQFFAPLWFEIIKRVIKPAVGHLFLAADPSQGFLRRGQSWLSGGLEVRGRSLRLERSYRTTRQILTFATLLYQMRLPALGDDEDIVAPKMDDMPDGVLPQIVQLTSEQDEVTRVVNEVKQLVRRGVRPGHILVIHANWHGAEWVRERLCKDLGPKAAVDPKEVPTGDHIRVCTLNAVAGLESPLVFLMGTRTLFEQEGGVHLADGERAELVRDNTRKLYMAITRAGQRLVMTYVGEVPEALKHVIGIGGQGQLVDSIPV